MLTDDMVNEMVERQDVGCLVMQATHRKGVEVVSYRLLRRTTLCGKAQMVGTARIFGPSEERR